VKEAIVGEGPTMKRMMARARGSGSRILKRTSHIRIVLSDEIPIETRAIKKAKRKAEEKVAKKEGTASETKERSTSSVEKKPKAKKAGKETKK